MLVDCQRRTRCTVCCIKSCTTCSWAAHLYTKLLDGPTTSEQVVQHVHRWRYHSPTSQHANKSAGRPPTNRHNKLIWVCCTSCTTRWCSGAWLELVRWQLGESISLLLPSYQQSNNRQLANHPWSILYTNLNQIVIMGVGGGLGSWKWYQLKEQAHFPISPPLTLAVHLAPFPSYCYL